MIQLIRSSIEPRAFIAGRGRCAVRAAEGVDAGTPCLLVVASLVHRKGIDVLLKALARLASDGLEPVLWIAGEGEEHSNLERLSTRLQLTKQVRFLGQRDDVADLIQASDLVVLPSRLEGLGVAALEAMALGRPVVASNVGGLAEAIDDEHTGLLVPPEDPAALAAALARLTQDPALRRRLGDAGPQRIEAEYHSEGMTDQYERLCFTILEEAQPT
jgi:glycosyltransferase involved in cell wall biosynthesis